MAKTIFEDDILENSDYELNIERMWHKLIQKIALKYKDNNSQF